MSFYKFLDVGCKIGGSFTISNQFGYLPEEGLGIDININSVNKFIKTGNHGIVADATDLPFKDSTFELVIFSHVIEHLPNKEMGFKSLMECIRVSSKYVFLALPFFDEDDYLNSLGLKTYYSDWVGHKNKVHLTEILENIPNSFKYDLKMVKKMNDSTHSEILPLNAPQDSFDYDVKLHGEKPIIVFDRDIWREYSIIIKK